MVVGNGMEWDPSECNTEWRYDTEQQLRSRCRIRRIIAPESNTLLCSSSSSSIRLDSSKGPEGRARQKEPCQPIDLKS